MGRVGEGVGRARTEGRYGDVGRASRPCGHIRRCQVGWLSRVGQLGMQVERVEGVRRRAEPGGRAGQQGQRHRAGRGPHQGGNHVSRGGGRPGQGGRQADGGENREPPHTEGESAYREHPHHRRVQGEDHQDAAEQHGLVIGAEPGDGEVLDLRRGEIDGGLADREHWRALRNAEARSELSGANGDGCREHAGHSPEQGARVPSLAVGDVSGCCHQVRGRADWRVRLPVVPTGR